MDDFESFIVCKKYCYNWLPFLQGLIYPFVKTHSVHEDTLDWIQLPFLPPPKTEGSKQRSINDTYKINALFRQGKSH